MAKQTAQIEKTYDVWAPVYDFFYGLVFEPGRLAAMEKMNVHAGERILEIGVGTGKSIAHYPKNIHLTGIDISEKMLDKARRRAAEVGLNADLRGVNGENTPFPDGHFDKIAMMYVYSVCANPDALLNEALRICKKGGEIVILNHFSHYYKNSLTIPERIAKPFEKVLGYSSDFSYQEHIASKNLQVLSVESVNIGGITQLVHIRV